MIADEDDRNPPDLLRGLEVARVVTLRVLTSSIEEAKCIGVLPNHDSNGVVVKDLWVERWAQKRR